MLGKDSAAAARGGTSEALNTVKNTLPKTCRSRGRPNIQPLIADTHAAVARNEQRQQRGSRRVNAEEDATRREVPPTGNRSSACGVRGMSGGCASCSEGEKMKVNGFWFCSNLKGKGFLEKAVFQEGIIFAAQFPTQGDISV